MKSKNIIHLIILLISVALMNSCKKMVEVATPQNQLTTNKVFADSTSALAAMVNVYALFNNTIDPNYNINMSCYADELQYAGSTDETLQYFQSFVASSNTTNSNFWKNSYFAIYSANLIIEELQKSSKLSKAKIAQFTNEAKFLRAMSYFYLINTYGSVPLILQTDVNASSHAAQSDSVTVYQRIVQDLKDAQNGLPVNYIGTGRVRANKYAASALLAKVCLWQRDWANAESAASSVIESGLYTPLPAPAQAFLASSQETILAFWTQFGYIYNGPDLVPSSGAPLYFFSPSQINSFETGDQRKLKWILTSTVGTDTYYSPYKYHNSSDNTASPEYLIALRAGEQYLIRAESRTQQNNITGAIADMNVIRKRAGLGNYAGAADKASILTAINQERRVELFTEWGNRYLDLKRTGTLSSILGSIKSAWKPTGVILPIPQYEMNTDPNLKQNAGY